MTKESSPHMSQKHGCHSATTPGLASQNSSLIISQWSTTIFDGTCSCLRRPFALLFCDHGLTGTIPADSSGSFFTSGVARSPGSTSPSFSTVAAVESASADVLVGVSIGSDGSSTSAASTSLTEGICKQYKT